MPAISVNTVDPDSPELAQVVSLGDKFRKTLGFFPHDAFSEKAVKKCILVAMSEKTVAGYLMFYQAQKGHVRIIHLCVDDPFRGLGIARKLFAALIERCREFHRITLSCCRDYPACTLWFRLGFVEAGTRPGRGSVPSELVIFVFKVPHRSLFEEDQHDEAVADIVIDANVFFDLEDPTRNEADESAGLEAEWIQPLIRLCVTDELHNELRRNSSTAHDASRRLAAFHTIDSNSVQFLEVHPKVVKLFPKARTDQEEADRRQLARAIVSNATAFVTRDQELLRAADSIYREFGLRVMRPSSLIGRFDEVRNESEYQRDRVAGTTLRGFKISQGSELLAKQFLDSHRDQKESHLRKRIDRWFSAPEQFVLHVIAEGDGSTPVEKDQFLSCFCAERTASGGLRVVFVRTRRQNDIPRQFGTVQRCILLAILQYAVQNGHWFVQIAGDSGPPELLSRLTELGFHAVGEEFFKLCPQLTGSAEEIAGKLAARCDEAHIKHLADAVLHPLFAGQKDVAFDLEERIWPAKIVGSEIPTFIVPIKPRWAKHLIGGGVRESDLFGTDLELAFNFQAVYYRAGRRGPRSRSRILWYVSADDKFDWAASVIACSLADFVEIGPAKMLYRKNERFGVFGFRDVLDAAGGDANADVMAIRFSNTERLTRPVSLAEAKTILSESGRWNNFQSPLEISEETFLRFYGSNASVQS